MLKCPISVVVRDVGMLNKESEVIIRRKRSMKTQTADIKKGGCDRRD